MSDTQPLLSPSEHLPTDNTSKKGRWTIINKLLDWQHSFIFPQRYREYEKVKEDNNRIQSNTNVGYFHLFRFADKFDLFLMSIGICTSLIYSIAFMARFVIFGRLTSILVMQSFSSQCSILRNTSVNGNNSSRPLWSTAQKIGDYHRSQMLTPNAKDTLMLLGTASQIQLFADMENQLRWLLITGPIELICVVIRYFVFTTTGRRQASHIRIRLLQSLLQRNIAYCDINCISQFNVKLFNNIDTFSKCIGFELSMVLVAVFSNVSSVCYALITNWQLTLVILLIVPLTIIGSYFFSKITAKETRNELDMYSKAGEVVQEVFSSLRTVLSFNGQDVEEKRYERKLDATRWSTIRKGAIFGLLVGWVYLIGYLIYLIGFSFGSFLMNQKEHDKLNFSNTIVVVILLAHVITHIVFVGPYFQLVEEARGALAPVFQLIDEAENNNMNETEIFHDCVGAKDTINMGGDIQFNNINFAYPSRPDVLVLKNLNLIARAGDTTALVGLNGSGKSTCLSLLLRFYEPSSGSITINDQSILDFNIKQLRQRIGVISQEPVLFATSIYENIRFGKENATKSDIEDAARQANAHDFIMQLPNKYDTIVGERGVQLSGGEKQRVALARALVKQPNLLLLDEATSALDRDNEKIVQEALDRACKGRTTIVVAHRLATIKNAHNIYVFHNGCVIEQGTHENLMSKEGSRYYDIMNVQQREMMENDINQSTCFSQTEDDYQNQMLERSRYHSYEDLNNKDKTSSIINRWPVFLRLLFMNRSEWLSILIGCIACLISGILQLIQVILLTNTLSAFGICTYEERYKKIITFCLLLLLMGVILLIIRFIEYTAFAISGSKLTVRICVKAFTCYLRQEVAFFDLIENNSGAICNQLSSDALAIQKMVGIRLGIVIESITMFGIGAIVGFLFSWQLTLITFFFIIFLFIISIMQIYWEARLNKQSARVLGLASSLAVEIVHNMRTVKQLAREVEFLRQFSALILEELKIRRYDIIISSLLESLYWGSGPFILLALYAEALKLFKDKELKMNNMTIVFAYYIFTFESIRCIMTSKRQMSDSLSAARNFFDLFDRIPSIDNNSMDGQQLDDLKGEIKFDQIKFAYASRPRSYILDKFQLTIKPGERVALVGISGCGKSTIIQLLERFYDPMQGHISLDNIDIRKLNIKWLRSCFGLVSQEPVLFDLTIAENISYGRENTSMEEIINAAMKAKIHDFIQRLPQGYHTRAGMKGCHLSGGEKQRVALARVLIRQPKILLLDEATSAMDSYNEQIVQEALEKAQMDDPTRTSLIIAHRLSTIRSCDFICVLQKGRIIESGTHADLMEQRGAYYRMNFGHFNS